MLTDLLAIFSIILIGFSGIKHKSFPPYVAMIIVTSLFLLFGVLEHPFYWLLVYAFVSSLIGLLILAGWFSGIVRLDTDFGCKESSEVIRNRADIATLILFGAVLLVIIMNDFIEAMWGVASRHGAVIPLF